MNSPPAHFRHAQSAVALVVLVLAAAPIARGGGDPSDGHTHGAEAGGAASATATAVTTAAMTVRFEAVLKHAPMRGGRPYTGTLYLADFPTNAPVAGATVTLQGLGLPNAGTFVVEATDIPGVYAVTRPEGFPTDGTYDLALTVAAGGASDLLLLQRVYIGVVVDSPEAPAAEGDGGGFPWVWILAVLLLGAAIAAFLVRSARQRRAEQGATRADPPAAPAPTSSVLHAPHETARPARRDRPVAGPRA